MHPEREPLREAITLFAQFGLILFNITLMSQNGAQSSTPFRLTGAQLRHCISAWYFELISVFTKLKIIILGQL